MFFNQWKRKIRSLWHSAIPQQANRADWARRRRLHFEPLESRQLLSVTIPVTVTQGAITVQETRTSYDATYDQINVNLTGLLSPSTEGAMPDLQGAWTATGGAFYLTGSFPTDTLNGQGSTPAAAPAPPESFVNFPTSLSYPGQGRTQATPPVANQYTSFAAGSYTSTGSQFLTYPNSSGTFDTTLLATMYVTKTTTSVAFNGVFGFTKGGSGSGGTALITFAGADTAPATPTAASPASGAAVGLTPMLTGSAYSQSEDAAQTGAEFQVATDASFSSIIWDNSPTGAVTTATVPAGKLSAGNTYYWRVRYDDATTASAWSNPASFATSQPVTLSPTTLPADTVGVAYNQTIAASGGTGTITLAVSNVQGTIPGLTVPTNGTGSLVIAGTPTSPGTETFTVTATATGGETASGTYTITTNPAVSLPRRLCRPIRSTCRTVRRSPRAEARAPFRWRLPPSRAPSRD